ncbi:thiamine phosphate synthase [Roseococcus sp. YIM B11640]|uniref:thiamine phosphate synthase n=1 Tax=Roseococcus sp. YIM B11640 TaxID=3133973 RepID=UPI003C7C4A83
MSPRIRNARPGASQAVPRVWLVTDPRRLPDPTPFLGRLPRGAAVLLRGIEARLAGRVAARCRALGLRPVVSGDGRLALRIGAGLHVPDRAGTVHLLPFLLNRRGFLLSVAVHGRHGIARARRLGADAVLVSPAFPTESHPGAPALGPHRWAALAKASGAKAVALGGMTSRSAKRLPRRRLAGWAAIGAWG